MVLNGNKKKPIVEAAKKTKKVPEGKRNNEMTALAGKLRRNGLCTKSIYAALFYENEKRCNPPLPDNEIFSIANSVGRHETGERELQYQLLSAVQMRLTMTIRQTILRELERRGWSRYRLVKELDGEIPMSTIYDYLSGKTDIGSDRVSIILKALGLTITSKSTIKRGKRPERRSSHDY